MVLDPRRRRGRRRLRSRLDGHATTDGLAGRAAACLTQQWRITVDGAAPVLAGAALAVGERRLAQRAQVGLHVRAIPELEGLAGLRIEEFEQPGLAGLVVADEQRA